MSDTHIPEGKEREVRAIGGAAIDGTPIAYIIVLASVTTVLAFIPFSITLGSGKGIPLSHYENKSQSAVFFLSLNSFIWIGVNCLCLFSDHP